jgi:hypothetical protein
MQLQSLCAATFACIDLLSESKLGQVLGAPRSSLASDIFCWCTDCNAMTACAGHKVRSKDVIKLIGGGTGFAGKEGQRLQSDKKYLLGPGSGMADLRGQAASGASRFGLSFQN